MSTHSLLILIPQQEEIAPFLEGCRALGCTLESVSIGRLSGVAVQPIGALVAVGGNGKAQFALQTQHLIDGCGAAAAVLCVGAAGRLSDELKVGDVVVGTCTVEHDYRDRFTHRPAPCHRSDDSLVGRFRRVVEERAFPFAVRFGPIASGDEDIIDRRRAAELRAQTDALCVAWEGSGGARAAAFNGLPFAEIRGITDGADADAAASFRENLPVAMPNISRLVVSWAESC